MTLDPGPCAPGQASGADRLLPRSIDTGDGETSSTTALTAVDRTGSALAADVGLAVSDDLLRWEKHPANPVLEADARWYELFDPGRRRDQSWRDPWLLRHPVDGSCHALITARSPTGAPGAASVVGHPRSISWSGSCCPR